MTISRRGVLKIVILLTLLLLGLGLCVRSFYVWNNCGYDCPIFPAWFPVQLTSTFGGILGLIVLLALLAMAMSVLLEKGK